jgi:hypothetical protein
VIERFFIRNFDADDLMEVFFISAITAILSIRFFLSITDYPELSIRGLHIAHVLWGGLLMFISTTILFNFLSRTAFFIAAIIGGIGFGAFIDELGKFITSDNNYFFEPTIALIYMTFVVLYLSTKFIGRYRAVSKTEYLVNAIEILKEAAINDLDAEEKSKALEYLKKADQTDPITLSFESVLKKLEQIKVQNPSIFSKIRENVRQVYWGLVKEAWFIKFVIIIFILQAFASLGHNINIINLYLNNDISRVEFPTLAESIFSIASAVIIFLGIIRIYFSRYWAYRMFQYAILVSIFLTQFFTFYREQFLALLGVLFNLIILGVIQYALAQEKAK